MALNFKSTLSSISNLVPKRVYKLRGDLRREMNFLNTAFQ